MILAYFIAVSLLSFVFFMVAEYAFGDRPRK